jgi:ubiquinone/menaquinone biosynthesis C-methylase UbiE
MDVLDMSEFKNSEFNVVVDKGTLDSVLCGDNSEPNAHKMLSEIYRVLHPNGTYVCITYGDEEHRRKYLVRHISVYVLRKLRIGILRLIRLQSHHR